MEQDRYGTNSKLYILGMICLVLSLGLFFLSLYILPYLIWQLNYNVPDIVERLLATFQDDYNYSTGASKALVWLLIFVPSVITGIISYYVSNHIDNQIYKEETKTDETEVSSSSKEIQREMKESASLGLKILGLMILIVVIILLLQFVVQSTV